MYFDYLQVNQNILCLQKDSTGRFLLNQRDEMTEKEKLAF